MFFCRNGQKISFCISGEQAILKQVSVRVTIIVNNLATRRRQLGSIFDQKIEENLKTNKFDRFVSDTLKPPGAQWSEIRPNLLKISKG